MDTATQTGQDYILNGYGHGPVGSVLGDINRFDPGVRRPYVNDRGQLVVNILTGKFRRNDDLGGLMQAERAEVEVSRAVRMGVRSPAIHDVLTGNAYAFPKDWWTQTDTVLQRVARQRLRLVADIGAVNRIGGFNGYAKSTYEYQAISDPGSAVVDMEALAAGRNDGPLFKLRSIPLPITHSDWFVPDRQNAIMSGGPGPSINATMLEASGRRVAEEVEKTAIGTVAGVQYGGVSGASNAAFNHDNTSKVYGLLTHPARIIGTTITAPTGSNPEATVANVLAMRQTMYGYNFFGPFMVYHSGDWDTYLDNDYARLGGSNANMTLRDRIRRIEGVSDIKRLDYLPGATYPFTLFMVSMTSEYVALIDGMPMTTVQWDTRGGGMHHYKVMCIWVPLFKYDYNGIAPIYQNSV